MKRYQVVHAPTKDRFSECVTYRDTDDRQDAVQGFVIAAARWDGYVAERPANIRGTFRGTFDPASPTLRRLFHIRAEKLRLPLAPESRNI